MNRINMDVELLKKVLNYYPDKAPVKFTRRKGVIFINIKYNEDIFKEGKPPVM